jgi:2-(1,2-epoxy-1,2-dihydrophenyl)acetyl-CoA isomerase
MSDLITTELRDGIFMITMDHPKANALTLEMVGLLQGAFKQAARQNQARVVLFRGAGDNFSAGQDVYEILKAGGESYRQHLLETYNPLVLQIRRLELPVLAEIQGWHWRATCGLPARSPASWWGSSALVWRSIQPSLYSFRQ